MGSYKSKQPFEKTMDGKKVRHCIKYNVWVNRDGTYAAREYRNTIGGMYSRKLIIYTRADGSRFLDTQKPCIIPLDEAVAICYCRPKPSDGKNYVLVHKDGKLGNCNASNLEWQLSGPAMKRFKQTDTKRKLENSLVVRSDGSIFDKGKKLYLVTSVGDADTDRSCVAVEPFVRYYRTNRYKTSDECHRTIDELMAHAEFIDGDDSSMSRPKILHKDENYLNFNSSNLVWIEEDSPEYQSYIKKKQEDMDQLTIKGNPGHSNPLLK